MRDRWILLTTKTDPAVSFRLSSKTDTHELSRSYPTNSQPSQSHKSIGEPCASQTSTSHQSRSVYNAANSTGTPDYSIIAVVRPI